MFGSHRSVPGMQSESRRGRYRWQPRRRASREVGMEGESHMMRNFSQGVSKNIGQSLSVMELRATWVTTAQVQEVPRGRHMVADMRECTRRGRTDALDDAVG